MPLSKLFHKRSNQKNKKIVSDSVDVCERNEFPKTHEEDSENQDASSKLSEEVRNDHQSIESKNIARSDFEVSTEIKENDTTLSRDAPSSSKQSRIRTYSESNEKCDLEPETYVKRKYGSESEVIENHAGEEGFKERLIQLREKDLEALIGHYVNKLVRDSIVSAVKHVSMDGLYEEFIERVSDRSLSQDSELTEQILSKDSSRQNAEMEGLEGESKDCSKTIEKKSSKEDENIEWEIADEKGTATDGYNTDNEQFESLYSTISDSKEKRLETQDPAHKYCPLEATVSLTNKNIPDAFTENASNEAEKPSESKENGNSCIEVIASSPSCEEDQPFEIKESMSDSINLMLISPDSESPLMIAKETEDAEALISESDLGENLPEHHCPQEEKKVNWKVGYLHVKLPHKSRGKGHLKVWKKRCVAIQPDEFVNDPKNPCLMISVYSAESGSSRKHSAHFWKSVSCNKAVVYRSSSKTHRYAFTISDDNKAVIHLAGDSEAVTQEWMAAIRAILWPPSPVMQLEKMLSGSEFDISIIDNEFSYRAGLLGMYGYLTITPKKLILVHPQQGYVIQEWYLNTVDKFQLMPQTRIEDVHKVLAMTTCSDSSTGKGEILIFCNEAVAMLQSLASTIHQLLTYHSKQEGGKYKKELEEIADWLVPPVSQASGNETLTEDYYKVPPRQVKSLLDIPNFIFEKPLTPVASVAGTTEAMSPEIFEQTLETSRKNPATASHDSGISSGTSADDFLNCSVTSFLVGGGPFPEKSSDSELSDTYTPPRTPETQKKIQMKEAGVESLYLEG